jgi:exosortase
MTSADTRQTRFNSASVTDWPLILGFVALAVPTFFTLARESWSRDSGAHGPLILFVGGWLLYREWPDMRAHAKRGNLAVTAVVLLAALASYVFGRAYDYVTLEAGGAYLAGLAMAYSKLGLRAMARHWFPFLFFAFAVPPPVELITTLTLPLKHLVSYVSTEGLYSIGFQVQSQGVTIYVAQYQLLVEDACSGMNSLIGLSAISLLYVYLKQRSSWRYSLLLTAFVIPIAIVANIVRIIILILLTYFFGDQVAQSYLHAAAGLVLFGMALLLVFALDEFLSFLITRVKTRGRSAHA